LYADLKIIIREGIYCDKNNMKKYLSAQYVSLVNRSYYHQPVTLICFPADKLAITSKSIRKALKKIKNTEVTILYFARCFTLEARKIIYENNGTAFSIIDFLWTDDSYNQVYGGEKS